MNDAAEKLRFLARQSRQLSVQAQDTQRREKLRSLAALYERQAADLEHCELA